MLKAILAITLAVQVVAFSQDAGELALWLPGLLIGCVGLALGDRRHFNTNDLFFILFLFLFVVAPADQIDGRRFQGDLSVRGIIFPDHVLLRSVVLADLFGLCVVVLKVCSLMAAAERPLLRLPPALRRRLPTLRWIPSAPPVAAMAMAQAPALLRVSPADDDLVVLDFEPVDHDLVVLEYEPPDPQLVVLDDWDGDEEMEYDDADPVAIAADGPSVTALPVDEPQDADPSTTEQDEAPVEAVPPVAAALPAVAALPAAALPAVPALPAAAYQSWRPWEVVHTRMTPTADAPAGDSSWLLATLVAVDCAMLGLMVMLLGTGFITGGRDYTQQLAGGNMAVAVVIQAVLQLVPLVGLIVGIIAWQQRRTRGAALWLAALAVLCLMFNNPLNTARFQFGAYGLMVALFALRGRIPQAFCYVGLIAYLLVLMPVMSAMRHGGIAALATVGEVPTSLDFKQLDYDAFSMFTCAVYRTGDDGFAGGSYLMSVLLFFVPRGLWPDKPLPSSIDLGQFLMQHHSGWFDNLSCPPFGDFYMDFGTFGVIACGLLYGAMLVWSDRVISAWNGRTLFSCGVAAAVMGYLPILVRGSLGAVVGGFAVTVLLFLLVSRALPANTSPVGADRG